MSWVIGTCIALLLVDSAIIGIAVAELRERMDALEARK